MHLFGRRHYACIGDIESLRSSLHTAIGRANQLQRTNELLEAQLKRLKTVVADAERRQTAAATDAKQLSAEQDLDMKRKIHQVTELKQQVMTELPSRILHRTGLYGVSVIFIQHIMISAKIRNYIVLQKFNKTDFINDMCV